MAGDEIPRPEDDQGAWSFSRKDAARVAQVVKRVEAQYQNRPPQRARYPVGTAATAPGLIDVVCPSGIAAGNISAPASASVKILQPSGLVGLTQIGAPTALAYNQWGTAIAAGKYAKAHYRGGNLFIVVWDC